MSSTLEKTLLDAAASMGQETVGWVSIADPKRNLDEAVKEFLSISPENKAYHVCKLCRKILAWYTPGYILMGRTLEEAIADYIAGYEANNHNSQWRANRNLRATIKDNKVIYEKM